jgi:hypothetical protein
LFAHDDSAARAVRSKRLGASALALLAALGAGRAMAEDAPRVQAVQVDASRPDWENPAVYARGKMPASATHFGFESRAAALAGDITKSSRYLDLNGTWSFAFSPSADAAPVGFEKPGYDVSAWKTDQGARRLASRGLRPAALQQHHLSVPGQSPADPARHQSRGLVPARLRAARRLERPGCDPAHRRGGLGLPRLGERSGGRLFRGLQAAQSEFDVTKLGQAGPEHGRHPESTAGRTAAIWKTRTSGASRASSVRSI